MAEEFGVNFLGRVPIDPQFVMLVEAGRRPIYPVGTSINGHDMGEAVVGSIMNESQAQEPLVEKYRSCSLCPIFRGMTVDIIRSCGEAHLGNGDRS